MSKSILDVSGVGPSTAALLAEKGIRTAADLAALNVEQLAEVRGFSEIRAGLVIADAKKLVLEKEAPPIEQKKQPLKTQKDKKDKAKKDVKKKKDAKKKKVKKAEKNKKKEKQTAKSKKSKKSQKKAKK